MRICYINLTKGVPPRDKVYLAGFQANGVEIINCGDNSPALKKFWNILKKHKLLNNQYDILMVGYSAHILVPFARLISRKKVIFNALGSMYEGQIISRRKYGLLGLNVIYSWLVDFLAFHSATLNLVETNLQKEYLKKTFLLPDQKLLRAFTGADKETFFFDPTIQRLPNFTVLFRGGMLPESGVEYAIQAAHILQNYEINFRVIGHGIMAKKMQELIKKYGLKNIEWFPEKLTGEMLRVKMQECHISLGQLSDHDRLNRTIPHKTFESIAMKIPYLTARNKGILELLTENETCFCVNPADSNNLAEKILELKNNPTTMGDIAENAYRLYQRELQSKQLALHVLNSLKSHA